MKNKNSFPFRYVAGGCLAAYAVLYLLTMSSYDFSVLFHFAWYAAIVASLFLSMPQIATISSALYLVYEVVMHIKNIYIYKMLFEVGIFTSAMQFVGMIEPLILALFVLIACLNRHFAKAMGIAGAALESVVLLNLLFLDAQFDMDRLLYVLVGVGVLCLGFAFSELKDKPKVIAAAAPKVPGVTDTYEKLTHLKELLDKGVITQEEFDAKKKDILGS